MRRALIVAFAFIIGCRSEQPKADQPAQKPQAAGPAPVANSETDPDNCGLVHATANPDPEALVRDYVRRDARGEFLRTDAWADTAYECPNFLPGPDAFMVVTSSSVIPLTRTDSVAQYEVRSSMVGNMRQDSIGFIFVPYRTTKRDTFVVVRTPFGWRIRLPQLPDNVGVDAALASVKVYRHADSMALLAR